MLLIDQKAIQGHLRADRRATAVVRATRRNRKGTRNSNGKRGGQVSASHAGKISWTFSITRFLILFFQKNRLFQQPQGLSLAISV